MKKNIPLLILFFISSLILLVSFIAPAQNSTDTYTTNFSVDLVSEISNINIYDTVVFDFSNAIAFNDTDLLIPVSIISDDVVNALDFQLTYNHTNLLYETITNNTVYLSMTEFYNQADETIRFTSNSFTTYENHPVQLVFIRFKILSQQLAASDINPVLALLNGDPCTIKLIGGDITVGINSISTNDFAKVYPNPASETVVIESSENGTVQVVDLSGRELLLQTSIYANQKQVLNTQNLPNGIYLLKISNEQKLLSTKKIVIRN